MKKKEFVTTPIETTVTDCDIVKDFMQEEFLPEDWMEDCEPSPQTFEYFWDNYDLTEEDKGRIFSLIEAESKKECERLKEEEKDILKNRESIIEVISDWLDKEYADPGELGYMLSADEILDLIIQNGKK